MIWLDAIDQAQVISTEEGVLSRAHERATFWWACRSYDASLMCMILALMAAPGLAETST